MQSGRVAPVAATSGGGAAAPLAVLPGFLRAAVAAVPDPRRRRGTRSPLPALLALALAAILSGRTSVLAIARFGAEAPADVRAALGFPAPSTPRQSTLQRLFARLDPDGPIAALARACAPPVPAPAARGSQGVALDGKAQRGRRAADPTAGLVHARSAFCHDYGVVLAQAPLEHAGDKAEAELSVAPEVVASLDGHRRVPTGDALFCQRAICQAALDRRGDYLASVKENQPAPFADIRLLFEPPDPAATPTDRREATTIDSGHGRRADTRRLIASTDLAGYLDWPGHARAFRLERARTEKGKAHQVVRHGIASLPPAVADPARLLAIKRAHRQIENQLHRPKDVALGEDARLVHRGHGPDVLAILRNLAISLLRAAGISTIAAQLRHFSSHPEEAPRLVVGSPFQNA